MVEPAWIRAEVAVESVEKVLLIGFVADMALAVGRFGAAYGEIVEQAIDMETAAPTQEQHNGEIWPINGEHAGARQGQPETQTVRAAKELGGPWRKVGSPLAQPGRRA